MKAFFAGITAWAIELGIALLMIYGLKREEFKVIKNRKIKAD